MCPASLRCCASRGSNVFEGNWEQTSFADNSTGNGYGAAIVINTANPVVIRNSRLKAQCYCIQWQVVNSQLTVENGATNTQEACASSVPFSYTLRSGGVAAPVLTVAP